MGSIGSAPFGVPPFGAGPALVPTPPTPPSPVPFVQVFIGFGSSPSFAGLFVLDRSELDLEDVLAGATVMVDVSQWLSSQLSVGRGRSREVDAFQAGSLSFVLRNEDRRFDPTNTASPYYPGIVPRAPVQALIGGEQIFGGYVDDYDVSYIQPNVCEVSVTALDGFGLLASTKLSAASFPSQSSGARVSAVLARSEVAYPATSAIDAGIMTLQASTQDSVAALDHCQTAMDSEAGLLFVDRTGTLRFHDRDFVPLAIAAEPDGEMTFTDTGVSYNGEAIGYMDIGLASGAVLLFNRIEGSRSGGTKQTADNAGSQTAYGIRTLSLRTTENVSDADVLSLCQFLLGRYAQPEVRFDKVLVELAGRSLEQSQALARLDLGTVVIVERTPPGGGSPARITQLSLVEHIDWALDASGPTYRLTLGVGNISGQSGFVLGSSSFGIVSTNKLGL